MYRHDKARRLEAYASLALRDHVAVRFAIAKNWRFSNFEGARLRRPRHLRRVCLWLELERFSPSARSSLRIAACPASAASDVPSESGARTGSIAIAIPPGTDRDVSFAFGDGKVSLELPNGATFPLDFVRESNGLLRAGEVVPVDADHLRLDLRLAGRRRSHRGRALDAS